MPTALARRVLPVLVVGWLAIAAVPADATGRRLRAKGALTVVLTTTFVAKSGARLQATNTVVFARRG